MTMFFLTTPVTELPIKQLEEITPIKVRKKRAPKHNFKEGEGRVFAHKHANGGGWVADTAAVDDEAYVGPRAEVFGLATVKGTARLEGFSRAFGTALVAGGAILRNNARVYGAAIVRDKTEMFNDSRVYGRARVSGTSLLAGPTVVCEEAELVSTTVRGGATVSGSALLFYSTIAASTVGSISVRGSCILVHGTVRGWVIIDGYAQLLRSGIENYRTNQPATLTDFGIVTEDSNILYPIEISSHAVVVHSRLGDNYRPTITATNEAGVTAAPMQLSGRSVVQRQSFSSRAALQTYLDAAEENNERRATRQITPNGYVAGFAARQLPPPGPRRVMRLQEAAT